MIFFPKLFHVKIHLPKNTFSVLFSQTKVPHFFLKKFPSPAEMRTVKTAENKSRISKRKQRLRCSKFIELGNKRSDMSASINMMSISRTVVSIKFPSKSNKYQGQDTRMKKKNLAGHLVVFLVLCSPDEKSQTVVVKKCKMLKYRLIKIFIVMPAIKYYSLILLI